MAVEGNSKRWFIGKRQGGSFALAAVVCLVFVAGCQPRADHFEPNRLYATVLQRETATQTEEAAEDVRQLVERIFGTPEKPRWGSTFPAELKVHSEDDADLVREAEQLASATELARSAGAVSSDQEGVDYGLYRKHCVQCHGINGDGRGPAALLQAPYPRDYQHGMFKFKSTARGSKPLRSDLLQTLQRGIPGTSMPAFPRVPERDREALVDYVIYLAVRGEVERRLLRVAVDELDYSSEQEGDRWLPAARLFADEPLLSDEQQPASDAKDDLNTGDVDSIGDEENSEIAVVKDSVASEQLELIRGVMEQVLGEWNQASQKVVEVPQPPAELAAGSVLTAEQRAEAEALFVGQIANCSSCHGAAGDGVTTLPADYDEWTKEWTTRLGIDPKDKEAIAEFLAAGAFKPKPLPARDLTLGSYHGGGSDEELFRRLVAGIEGTPMPAASRVSEPGPTGLTDRQLWLLVRYVQALGPVKALGPEQEETPVVQREEPAL